MPNIHGASFRDPCGFVFENDGQVFRQVNIKAKADYDFFISSGLYDALKSQGLVISHEEISLSRAFDKATAYKVLKPKKITFISYPYEWSFSQLKDAALLTLEVQKISLERSMSLKDASAYNIQFEGCCPVFIDTLSFEKYAEGAPWAAYGQFCRHFLAPLALMSYTDARLSQLLKVYLDGVPLDLSAKLLPWRARLDMGLLMHLYSHSAAEKKYNSTAVKESVPKRKLSAFQLLAIIDSLRSCVNGLKYKDTKTQWLNYYSDTNYSRAAFEEKGKIVSNYLEKGPGGTTWDLGANDGSFSALAATKGSYTVAFDIDPGAVELNYLKSRGSPSVRGENILPLLLDLSNPSPALGWASLERESFLGRGPAMTVLALALAHHLAITNNVPLYALASFFSSITAGRLIIEFVPKTDSQVSRMLVVREDIFALYTEENFEKEFGEYFIIKEKQRVSGMERSIYLMEKKGGLNGEEKKTRETQR